MCVPVALRVPPSPLPWAWAAGLGRVCVLQVPTPLGEGLAVLVNPETAWWEGGGHEGRRKGLYHSGIKFSFIFLYIVAR